MVLVSHEHECALCGAGALCACLALVVELADQTYLRGVQLEENSPVRHRVT
jgi:hypothetical protein